METLPLVHLIQIYNSRQICHSLYRALINTVRSKKKLNTFENIVYFLENNPISMKGLVKIPTDYKLFCSCFQGIRSVLNNRFFGSRLTWSLLGFLKIGPSSVLTCFFTLFFFIFSRGILTKL